MSLAQVQSALAMLIRLPERNRNEEVESFLKSYELDAHEERQVRKLALDPNVTKFGRSMEGVRMETITNALGISGKLIRIEVLEYIHRNLFGPKATQIVLWGLPPAFLDFLLSDAEAGKIVRDTAPPYIFDVLSFERDQLKFLRNDLTIENSPSPVGSLLAHHAFICVKLNYDIPDLLLNAGTQDEAKIKAYTPKERTLTLLMIPKAEGKGCRYFEVDESIAEFLQGQRTGASSAPGIPESYADLVNLGLCRPLQ